MSLRPYFFGQNLMAGADLEQLVDLYDGNLLTVDEAVGLVFDASRRAGRWNDTLVVLTSDHGEAFMEHGRLGHNTTLYDEMLHVPLLVRLPGGEQPPHDPDRLAAVADVVPTILGRLGLRAGGGLAGIDLLAQQPDPRRPRLVMTRTSHPEQSWLAARSDRWKAIVWPNHQEQMLFDLEADPGETRNLLLERPLVFAALGLRLRDHLAATAGEVVGEAVDIPESEKRELRALGYVE
jgi:arylsulfatase A-like enzyme